MLQLSDIGFSYGTHVALESVSLTVQKGQALGLLGPNGAGKTTLLSLIAGLLPLQRGRIDYAGQALHDGPRPCPSPLAVVPQEYAFYPMLTCRENLRFFAEAQGLHGALLHERCDYCLAFTQLQDYAGIRAERLSGGLKRRLNLAIGLLTDPAILLLDEPTTGVDPHSRQQLIESLNQIKAAGKILLYTSHYLDELEVLADSLIILNQGRVVLSGAWADIRQQQARRWELVLATPLPPAALQQLAQLAQVDSREAPRYVIEARSAADAHALWGWLATLDIDVRGLYTGEASLERLYLQLTRVAH